MAWFAAVRRHWLIVAGVTLVVLFGLGVAAYLLWRPKPARPLPDPNSPEYQEYAEAFELGTAYLDAGLYGEALSNLTVAVDKVPEEPAAWANRGLMHLRRNELDRADADLRRAHELAPDNADIELLLGLLAQSRGAVDRAVEHYNAAVKGKPDDPAALFALARAVAKKPGSDAEVQRLMDDILRLQPNNLVALTERAGAAARQGDAKTLDDSLKRLAQLAPGWSDKDADKAREALEAVRKAAAGPLPGDVPEALADLVSLVQPEPTYQRDLDALDRYAEGTGTPLRQFVRLAPLRNRPADADTGLTFAAAPLGGADAGPDRWDVVLPVRLSGQGGPAVVAANASRVRRLGAPGLD